jgi:hypothetical protein
MILCNKITDTQRVQQRREIRRPYLIKDPAPYERCPQLGR